jgi:hypothetical protein
MNITTTGLAFAILFVAGGLLLGELLGSSGDSDRTFDVYFEQKSNRAADILGGYLLAASGLAFIFFTFALRARLFADAGRSAAQFVLISGATAGLLIIIAAAALMTVSFSIEFGGLFDDRDQFVTGASALPQFGYVLLCVLATLPAAALIAVTSIAARENLPRWLAYAGFPLALVLLLGFAVGPLFALPIWVTAIALTLRGAPATAHIPESVA